MSLNNYKAAKHFSKNNEAIIMKLSKLINNQTIYANNHIPDSIIAG